MLTDIANESLSLFMLSCCEQYSSTKPHSLFMLCVRIRGSALTESKDFHVTTPHLPPTTKIRY